MKKIILLLGFISLFMLQACTSAFQTMTEFNPVGRLDQSTIKGNIVSSVDDIAVYMKSSPEGFAVESELLHVEDGYAHKILGEIIINDHKPSNLTRYENAKQRTLQQLKQAAYDQGANAIIYCIVNVSNEPTWSEVIRARSIGLGTGWAVVVDEKYLN